MPVYYALFNEQTAEGSFAEFPGYEWCEVPHPLLPPPLLLPFVAWANAQSNNFVVHRTQAAAAESAEE